MSVQNAAPTLRRARALQLARAMLRVVKTPFLFCSALVVACVTVPAQAQQAPLRPLPPLPGGFAPPPPATVAAAGSAAALPPGAHPFLGKIPDNAPVVPAGGSAKPADLQKRIEQMREDLRKKRMPAAGH